MEALLSLLAKAAAVVVTFFISLGSAVTSFGAPAPIAPTVSVVASTSQPVALPVATTSTATSKTKVASTTQKTLVPIAQKNPKPETQATTSAPAEPAAPTYSVDELNQRARASLVNIMCTTAAGGSFNPISGSGVIVDSRGIILTNAHVAQYFLLRDYPVKDNVQCVIRTGSPAQPLYTATLMYLPPAWIDANASKISSTSPSGTGQNDYAFLRITGTTNPNGTLPSSFPALPMDGANPYEGEQMVLAAYPAGFLGGISIALNLYQTSAVAQVGQLYAFAGDNIDLFSLGGTVVSQAGSSGGAAVNPEGKLQGIIVTEIPAATTGARDLRALSLAHINRSLISEGMGGITALLSGDPASTQADFEAKTEPQETAALEATLKQQ